MMERVINLVDNVVETDLTCQLTDNEISLRLEVSDVTINIRNFEKKIKFIVPRNQTVNMTMNLMNNDKKITVDYLVEEDAYLNEFVFIEEDNISVIYRKQVNVLQNATYEVSNAFFNDCDLDSNIVVDLDGINAKALHNTATISRNDNIKNYHVTINNNNKMSYGELNNFGVVKDSATLKFNGVGYIKQGAKQASAHQASKIITFDPRVKAEANPYLIIDEADVAASHAAAVGKMDEEQLYYIQSRGIDLEEASKLITYGYLKPILKKIESIELKEKLEKLIEEKVVS